MRLSWTAILLLQQALCPCDASPVTRSQPSGAKSTTPVVVTTSSDGTTWSQTFTPTWLTGYASVTGSMTVTTTDDAGKVALVAVFAGGLAWVAIGAAEGPKPVPPPPTPPPEPPKPDRENPKTDMPKKTTATSTTTTVSYNMRPAQTPIVDKVRKRNKSNFHIFHVPYEERNCAEASSPIVDRNRGVEKIKKFCDKYKNKNVDHNGIKESFDMGRGIVLSLSTKLNPKCPAKFANSLRRSDCGYQLQACLDNCDLKTLDKHGSILTDGCFVWSALAEEYEGDLECQKKRGIDGDLGVERDKLMESIKDFCSKNGEKAVKPDDAISQWYYYDTRNSAAELSIRYNSEDCSPEKIPEYDIGQAACERFLAKAVDGCDTDTREAKYGGDVADHCGVFSVKTKTVETVWCGETSFIPKTVSMSRKDALVAIEEYCAEEIEVDPDYKYDGEFHKDRQDGNGVTSKVIGNIGIRMKAAFPEKKSQEKSGCPAAKRFKMQKKECKRKLLTIIDSCDTDTTTKKFGGVLNDKTSHGCVWWEIVANSAVDRR